MQNCFGLGGADLVIEIAGTDVEPPSPPRTAQSISRRGPIPVDRFLRPPSGLAGSPLAELAHPWQPTGMVLSLGFDRTTTAGPTRLLQTLTIREPMLARGSCGPRGHLTPRSGTVKG